MHLKDIHLEKGMHCVDCHFEQDSHGNGKLYGEPRDAVEIDCVDCHGTIDAARHARHQRPGLAAGGTDLVGALDAVRRSRASRAGAATDHPAQRWSTEGVEWEVPQVVDTITPGNPHYSERVAPGEDDPAGRHDAGATRPPSRQRSRTPTPR